MKLIRWSVFMLIVLLAYLWCQWPDGKLHVIFCDVGQGDAAIVVKGSTQIVIDTGPEIDKIDLCLNSHVPFWDRRIEAIYISHQHEDHVGGLNILDSRYDVVNQMQKTSKGDLLRYGSLEIDTLVGEEASITKASGEKVDENDSSKVLLLRDGKLTVLFTGDIGGEAELALTSSGVLNKVDVLKVAHHGSKFSTSNMFLETIKPKVAIVSAGRKNTFGHPSKDTLIRLDAFNVKVFRTDLLGTIEVISNGDTYEIRHKNPARAGL